MPQRKNDNYSFLFPIIRNPFFKGILIAGLIYIAVFQCVVFTMSPKKETINPNFYFLGSILNTYDIEKTTTRTPTLDDGRDQIGTITVPSNRGLEDEKNLMAKKSLPTNKLIKAYQKKNPPSYLFPLDLDGSSDTIDPTNKNIDPYIPLSLPHDNPY